MNTADFIVREPLLDPKERVVGYALTWQKNIGNTARPNALAECVAAALHDRESGWQLGDTVLFLEAAPASLTPEASELLPAKSTVFMVDADSLLVPETAAVLQELRSRGFGISVRYQDLASRDKSILKLISHVEVGMHAVGEDALAKIATALEQASIQVVSRDAASWDQFDLSSSLGLNAFAGDFCLSLRPGVQVKGLNPAQTIILQLMQLVRQNADVRKLEDVLRRDAAVSYKLLRYINSAGFGLGSEIQSLRHAVTMLGYSPLYRWLSLLLATAGANGQSLALMQTAVVRGRFAELLGQGFLPKSEVENLFVAGMFSLLDRLLGMPMEEVLESIQLSDAVSEALLTRGGMYGPFLKLAEACELGHEKIEPLADALFISAEQVNEAHMAALAWAQKLNL